AAYAQGEGRRRRGRGGKGRSAAGACASCAGRKRRSPVDAASIVKPNIRYRLPPRRVRWSFTTRAIGVVHLDPADPRLEDADASQVLGACHQRVGVEHEEIGPLSGNEAAEPALGETGVGGSCGIGGQRLLAS